MPTSPDHRDASAPEPGPRTQSFSLGRALAALRGHRAVVVFTHDNPDPDALAASLGLKRLLEHELAMPVTLALGGIVGRAENRAMVDLLRIPLVPVEIVDLAAFDTVALVDSQPETGNNSLPPGHRVDIVIDHHPLRPEALRAPWCDVRPGLGATSTIVFQYFREQKVPLDSALATAFFYALRTETRDLGRETTEAERAAYIELVSLVDHELIFRISRPKVPREHFAALDRALGSARVHGDIVAANLGALSYPDLVAEIADLLLAYDGARFVLCVGRFAGSAYLSLRMEISQGRADTIMRSVVGADGTAGGHGSMAGARLFVTIGSDSALETAHNRIVRRLCEFLGRSYDGATPLVWR